MEVKPKYNIGEWVWHRKGDEISYGKVVGYENDCYVIETLENDMLGYMRLTDEDVSKDYNKLND